MWGRSSTARGVKVTRDSISQTDSDFSSKIAKIPSNTQGIYIPWQLAPQAQAFGQQLKAAGKGHIKLFGSDGLFAPGVWKITGSYDSAFPYNPADPVVKAYIKAHHGNGEFFGLPSYVAAQVVVGAVTKACADGKATRAEVRKAIAKTKLKTSILGFPVSFAASGEMRASRELRRLPDPERRLVQAHRLGASGSENHCTCGPLRWAARVF